PYSTLSLSMLIVSVQWSDLIQVVIKKLQTLPCEVLWWVTLVWRVCDIAIYSKGNVGSIYIDFEQFLMIFCTDLGLVLCCDLFFQILKARLVVKLRATLYWSSDLSSSQV